MIDVFPTESEEQRTLFIWAKLQSKTEPELGLLYHIPNEGKRSPVTGGRLKSEGLKPGVPDICLPVARGKYHGLYIEMKRMKGGRVSEDQHAWITALTVQGYRAVVCRGWAEARDEIERYLNEKM